MYLDGRRQLHQAMQVADAIAVPDQDSASAAVVDANNLITGWPEHGFFCDLPGSIVQLLEGSSLNLCGAAKMFSKALAGQDHFLGAELA